MAACAGADPVAAGILRQAAGHVAEAAAAVCPAPAGPDGDPDEGDGAGEVALTGGLFRMGEPLLGPLREELARLLPGARVTVASGDPLTGALRIAHDLAAGDLRLPRHPTMLFVPPEQETGQRADSVVRDEPRSE